MTINLNDIKLSPVLESVYRSKISDAEYFSSSYSNYISNSRLKYINPDQGGSPSLYNKGIENKSTNSLELGTAIHELFLQPESFKLGNSYNKPTAKLGMVIDSIIKYRKQGYTIRESITKSCIDIDYYKNNLNESRIQNIIKSGLNYYQNCKDLIEGDLVILNDKHRTICSNCLESLSNNPSIVSLVRPEGLESYNEDALFIDIIGEYNNSKCILKLKMKADNWTIDKDNKIITLNDLKTTGHLLEQFMNGSFWNFHYHRQMGMYLWMLLQFCKKEYGYTPKDWTFQANIIAVETTGSNRASVFNIDSDILNIGRLEFCRLLKMVAYCEINGYSDDVTFI